MGNPIRVFLADDHTLVRQGIAALISREQGIEVVGESSDGLDALRQIEKIHPDVAVVDISLPQLNGLDLCQEIRRKCKQSGILVLTMHADEEYVIQALKAGAAGYMLKESAAEQFAQAVRAVAAGELYLGPGISRRVLDRLGEAESDPYDRLTSRERLVLQQIAEGRTNRQVAENLGVSVKTVDTHRTRLMRKLGIHDQTTLVRYAIRKGIVQLG